MDHWHCRAGASVGSRRGVELIRTPQLCTYYVGLSSFAVLIGRGGWWGTAKGLRSSAGGVTLRVGQVNGQPCMNFHVMLQGQNTPSLVISFAREPIVNATLIERALVLLKRNTYATEHQA